MNWERKLMLAALMLAALMVAALMVGLLLEAVVRWILMPSTAVVVLVCRLLLLQFFHHVHCFW